MGNLLHRYNQTNSDKSGCKMHSVGLPPYKFKHSGLVRTGVAKLGDVKRANAPTLRLHFITLLKCRLLLWMGGGKEKE